MISHRTNNDNCDCDLTKCEEGSGANTQNIWTWWKHLLWFSFRWTLDIDWRIMRTLDGQDRSIIFVLIRISRFASILFVYSFEMEKHGLMTTFSQRYWKEYQPNNIYSSINNDENYFYTVLLTLLYGPWHFLRSFFFPSSWYTIYLDIIIGTH